MKITYPGSEKVYLPGEIFPDIQVAMRRVTLTPTVTKKSNGEKEYHDNGSVLIYDTSGPYSDKHAEVDLKKGLLVCGNNGLPNAEESSNLANSPQRIAAPAWQTHLSTTCASPTTTFPSVPRTEQPSRKWHWRAKAW